jgi:hypothetical protein
VPEIAQANIPISIEQDVIGSQIAMNDVSYVGISHRKGNATNNSRNLSFPSQLALKIVFPRRKMARQ